MIAQKHAFNVSELTLFLEQSKTFLSSSTVVTLIPADLLFVPAMTLSLVAVVTSVHRYNERQTSSILTLVTLPFTFTTTTIRILSLAIIISVYPVVWSTVLTAGLAAALLVLNLVCSRQSRLREREEKEETTCLVLRLPGLILQSLASIISPLGYNSDR